MENNAITPQNLWERMLEKKHLLKLEHGRRLEYGFTIPFLIGAYYKRGFLKDEELQTSQCIRFVLENILKTATEENPVKIFDCSDLENEPVFQYLSTKINDLGTIQHLKSYHPNIESKIYWDKKEADIFDFESLVSFLWNKQSTRGGATYAQLISNQHFSCHRGIWTSFNDDEIKFITNQL